MELRDIFQILWKRVWLIILGTVLSAVITWALAIYLDPVYEAKVLLMVNQTTEMPLASMGILSSGERMAQTYSLLLKTRPLLEIVVANLDLDLTPEDLAKRRITTNLVPGTQLLELTVKDTNPQRASDIANEIAQTFVSMHSVERQLQSVVELEQDVTAEIGHLKELIEQNRVVMDRLNASGLLSAENPNPVEATLASQQNAYATLLGTYLSVQGLKTQLLDVTVAESAAPPAKPIGLSPIYYVLIGSFAGFSFAIGVVLLLDHLDRSFEDSEDVSRILALPTLGAIPQLQSTERRNLLSTSTEPHLAVSEAYRVLRTNIRFASVDRSLKTLLISSAEPSTGKSTVASNLGIVCAQGGLRVVVVDADLRRPNQHRLFGLNNGIGLTDLLVGDVANVEECMAETGIDNLRLIPSGPIPPNPSELLDSKRMEVVLEQIKEQADLVILDSSPALAVTDPVALGPRVDGTILTVMAKRTSQDIASGAYEALTKVGTTVLGVVLVGIKRKSGTYYYYSTKKQPLKRRKWKRPTWIARFPSRWRRMDRNRSPSGS